MMNWSRISQSCTKSFLIALNVLYMFIAICMFSCATVDMKVLAEYKEEPTKVSPGDVMIIVASILLFLLAVYGCVGTLRKCRKMLYTYIMLLTILLALEVTITIFVSMHQIVFRYRVTDWLREDFYRNVTGAVQVEHDQLWDKLQNHYECCGLNSPEDYAAIGRSISISCCQKAYLARNEVAKENMYRSCIESSSYHHVGCEDEIIFVLRTDDDWLFRVAVNAFWLEAMGMVLAMLVSNDIKNSVEMYDYTVKY